MFWKTNKLYVSSKDYIKFHKENKEKDNLAFKENQRATIMSNNVFIDITKDLGLKEDNSNENPLEDVLKSFNGNPSVSRIW